MILIFEININYNSSAAKLSQTFRNFIMLFIKTITKKETLIIFIVVNNNNINNKYDCEMFEKNKNNEIVV